MTCRPVLLALVLLAAPCASASADVLVLANGQRLDGELLGVYGQEVEFEERNGGRRRVVRVRRDEIDRVEFERSGRRERDRVSDARPRGLRERRTNVSAREAWTDTGIDVRRGQEIYFEASGETRWGADRRDGADGERNSPVNPGRPLPDRPAAALVGRIGDTDDVFFIGGESGAFRMRETGRLYLGINDDVLTDNSGTLRVTVYF